MVDFNLLDIILQLVYHVYAHTHRLSGARAMSSEAISSRRSRPVGAPLDRTALRVNQASIIVLLAIGFVLDQPWLVVFVCAVMAIGTAFPRAALFQRVYRDILRPAGLLRPDPHDEDAAPHRFAQGLGAAFLLAASAALFSGAVALGWGWHSWSSRSRRSI